MMHDSGDQIILRDISLYGYHGVLPEENRIGCRFVLNVTCGLDLSKAANSDEVNDTISYADIYDRVQIAFSNQRFNLLEALAQHIIDDLFAQFALLDWVQLYVAKLEAPIPVTQGEFGVKLTRSRNNG